MSDYEELDLVQECDREEKCTKADLETFQEVGVNV